MSRIFIRLFATIKKRTRKLVITLVGILAFFLVLMSGVPSQADTPVSIAPAHTQYLQINLISGSLFDSNNPSRISSGRSSPSKVSHGRSNPSRASHGSSKEDGMVEIRVDFKDSRDSKVDSKDSVTVNGEMEHTTESSVMDTRITITDLSIPSSHNTPNLICLDHPLADPTGCRSGNIVSLVGSGTGCS